MFSEYNIAKKNHPKEGLLLPKTFFKYFSNDRKSTLRAIILDGASVFFLKRRY